MVYPSNSDVFCHLCVRAILPQAVEVKNWTCHPEGSVSVTLWMWIDFLSIFCESCRVSFNRNLLQSIQLRKVVLPLPYCNWFCTHSLHSLSWLMLITDSCFMLEIWPCDCLCMWFRTTSEGLRTAKAMQVGKKMAGTAARPLRPQLLQGYSWVATCWTMASGRGLFGWDGPHLCGSHWSTPRESSEASCSTSHNEPAPKENLNLCFDPRSETFRFVAIHCVCTFLDPFTIFFWHFVVVLSSLGWSCRLVVKEISTYVLSLVSHHSSGPQGKDKFGITTWQVRDEHFKQHHKVIIQ
jgi:hypothetical protein